MSDIVAWLRERSTVFHLAYIGHELREAADEIERLRDAIKRQAAAAKTGMDAATRISRGITYLTPSSHE